MCYIQFTNSGIVIKLPSQLANSFGEVIWDWNVNTSGFAVGNWKITAVTTYNNQSTSTQDSKELTIKS
jgi:hypothetical protein